MHKKFSLFFFTLLIAYGAQSQELQARVNIITNKVSSTVDKKIFQTLQSGLTNFLNGRRWTNDGFQPAEKIQCSFLLTIDQALDGNVYKGKLTVQAARPIFNTAYESPIVNFLDDDVSFKYIEFQPIEFNENRVQGNDPIVSNLTAVFAYYVNIILGFDYASFSTRGGDPYFLKAWNIVNNAPENKDIRGWKSFESLRNRYWLAENLNNSRFALFHDAVYAYYRTGLDVYYENEEAGRTSIFNCLNLLNSLNNENANSMIMQFFFQGKNNELVKVFSKANPEMKTRAKDILSRLDLTHASSYKDMK
ncbi:MAG: DUF4835 family protein [Chitinophagaceae bacterium]|nr:DUF4835 family protein [Chitinophagaceae bacterium]